MARLRSNWFAEKHLKEQFTELMDAIVKREMPNNLQETQFMEYADLEVYGKMREMQTALNEYVDECDSRIKALEDSIDELNEKLLVATKVAD